VAGRQVAGQRLFVGLGQPARSQPRGQILQVAPISSQRIFGQPVFEPDRVDELV